MGAGAGAVTVAGKGFKAGNYYNRTATVATLSKAELRHATKIENIDGLLTLASAERRWSLDETSKLQAWERYNAIPDGGNPPENPKC
jgi:hypothetical protein